MAGKTISRIFLIVTVAILLSSVLVPFLPPLAPIGLLGDDITMSWVILGLVPMVTLSYVDLLNKLGDKRRDMKHKSKDTANADRIILLLTWAVCFMLITVSALTLRILLCSYGLTCTLHPVPSIDYIVLYSFCAGSILRIWLFFQSYTGQLQVG